MIGRGGDGEGRGSEGEPESPAGKKPKKSAPRAILELVAIAAVALLAALGITAYGVKAYRIPSGSMEPTLLVGDRVIANRLGMEINGPYVGEIAVFHPPAGAKNEQCGASPGSHVTPGRAACDQTNTKTEPGIQFIKRVVAGPGDEIYISEGHVYRKPAGKSNFVREKDPYIAPCSNPVSFACNFHTAIKIPAGHWFMMGDNRGGSDDSRYWGPVPTSWFIGGALMRYWPPHRIGSL